MPPSHLPKVVYDWDINSGASSWSSVVRQIIHKPHLDPDLEWGEIYNLTGVNNKLLELSRLLWNLETPQKPELRTFVKVHDFWFVLSLTRTQRSKLIQLKFGILQFSDDQFENMSNLLKGNILFQWVCPPNLFIRNAKVLCICDDQ